MNPLSASDGNTHFDVVPDPPIAGEPAEVQYKGSGSGVNIYVDGRYVGTKRPGKDGKFKIDRVPAGRELTLSDGRGYPGYVVKDILELEEM